uniref:CCHC-type domain-containing protein n=1 Tax=Globodera pallida TaxID=36090 RepID=A0A183CNE8_GLOPA
MSGRGRGGGFVPKKRLNISNQIGINESQQMTAIIQKDEQPKKDMQKDEQSKKDIQKDEQSKKDIQKDELPKKEESKESLEKQPAERLQQQHPPPPIVHHNQKEHHHIVARKPPVVCFYCKYEGHMLADCEKRMHMEAKKKAAQIVPRVVNYTFRRTTSQERSGGVGAVSAVTVSPNENSSFDVFTKPYEGGQSEDDDVATGEDDEEKENDVNEEEKKNAEEERGKDGGKEEQKDEEGTGDEHHRQQKQEQPLKDVVAAGLVNDGQQEQHQRKKATTASSKKPLVVVPLPVPVSTVKAQVQLRSKLLSSNSAGGSPAATSPVVVNPRSESSEEEDDEEVVETPEEDNGSCGEEVGGQSKTIVTSSATASEETAPPKTEGTEGLEKLVQKLNMDEVDTQDEHLQPEKGGGEDELETVSVKVDGCVEFDSDSSSYYDCSDGEGGGDGRRLKRIVEEDEYYGEHGALLDLEDDEPAVVGLAEAVDTKNEGEEPQQEEGAETDSY